MPKADTSIQTRLAKALKYLQMARTSRELSYDSIPYVVAAEHLIGEAMEKNKPADLYQNWNPTTEFVPNIISGK